ncbi:PHB depolymerase family esterase [uncultured Roseovarius sp.]|jgi:polyhydroxybutyrate depolymerase|uniref:alpha/beta hydrolase family esterase n=1 Tax=uncultured Roseovarius sp. TaxID=293344 RepID=UPI002617C47A|nr:PHB depolymerase family esterase [uncultured Roseovarius sp.]
MRLVSVLALCLGLTGPLAAAPLCGDPDTPCETATGSYHIALPEGPGPHPVLVFLHGYGGRGGPMVEGATARDATARGYAYIAPNGLIRPARTRPSWNFHPDFPGQRDEAAFLQEVMQDAATRFDIDPKRSLLAGFSIGGSLASYIACATPKAFSAYAPVSGSFWRPHPTGCAGPVRLLHAHGWRDEVVPLEGRVIRQVMGRDFAQGDVIHAMGLWRAANGCENHRADRFETTGNYWRRIWTRCTPGSALEFALFDGGHTVPKGWSTLALDWFETLDGPGQ